MYDDRGLFIDGAWRPSEGGETRPVFSPVTERRLGDVPWASGADTASALDAAERGMAALRALGNFGRADALHRVADAMTVRAEEAARLISTETGRPIAQSQREWSLSTDQMRWHAEEARRIYGRVVESRAPGGRFEVLRQPVGIVAAFTAWNFPAVLVARKLAPALAAGCAVILRADEKTPGSAMIVFECLREAGLPAGAANLLVGPIDATYAPLMAAKQVRKVTLTGSIRVGKQMLRDAADTVKKASMELGGNAPMIVHDDADIEAVLDAAVPAKYANAGQVCITPDRFLVHESRHDAFVEGFAARAAALRIGDGLDPDTQLGPLITAEARDRAEARVAEAQAQGARLVTGGKRPADRNTGYFLQPAVLAEVSDEISVMAGENFAPIAAIAPFSTEDEAITRANATDAGLAAYCFTRDAGRARRAVEEIRAGMVGINSFALAASEAPFGGTGFSGMGREGGAEAIGDYQDTKLAQVAL